MKKAALIIGHKESSQGACNDLTGTTEWGFNDMLVTDLHALLAKSKSNVSTEMVYRDTYRDLPDKVDQLNPDFIISFHCNAFNTSASGTETLYYHKSKAGRAMAEILNKHMVSILGLPDRGVRPRETEDRGGYLLRYTKAPCVIIEPFFIDNNRDLQRMQAVYMSFIKQIIIAMDDIVATI